MSNISQKPEKIASAIYLITSFFAEQEPIKWKLRTLAADLVSVGLSLTSQMFRERDAARMEVRSIVLEINGLISVAKNVGIISEPNHALMQGELLKYLDLLGFPEGLREEQGLAVLSENFFAPVERGLKAPEEHVENEVKDKSPKENLSDTKDSKVSPIIEPIKRQYLDDRALIHTPNSVPVELLKVKEPHVTREKNLSEFGAVSVKKNSRQSVIIGLLKRKKEIMIKDVSPLISGCSEKTIQRELSAMVQSGILRKTGEKRWSRYSLA